MPEHAPRSHHALVELIRARLFEIVREPEALFWMFVFPVLMAVALGIAFPSRTVDTVIVGVLEGPDAARTATVLTAVPGVEIKRLTPDDAALALRRATVQLVVEPGPTPTYRFDPARPESRLARRVVDDALQRAAGRTDPFVPREARSSTAGARYVDWLVPGLLGITIMSDSLWGIGFSIVNARLRNLLKRLSATPMRRRDYLLGHALARLGFLVLEAGVLLGAGRFLFGVPLHGPAWLVAVVCVLGALSFAGLGLLVASRVRTIEALSGLMNLIMLPMWIVSGVFFSSANFPDALQPAIRALPLTALNDALRAVLLEGQPLPAIGPQVTVLTLWGGVSFLLAMRVFRWR